MHDQLRRDRSLDLLKHTTLPVEAVASAAGFNDIRAFKRRTGARPSSLRQI